MNAMFFAYLIVAVFSLGGWAAGIYRQELAMIGGGVGILGMLVSLLV